MRAPRTASMQTQLSDLQMQMSGALVAEAGCTLQQCDDAAGEAGCRMPLDLGPRQQCHIGGNISSNAGALNRICADQVVI